jgi:hypothetical protein
MNSQIDTPDWSKIPAPTDDGAARHLTGMGIPSVSLPANDGPGGGRRYPFGEDAVGYIMYSETGVMAVQIARRVPCRGGSGCPQESPNRPQVPPRTQTAPSLPFPMSRAGRRGRPSG